MTKKYTVHFENISMESEGPDYHEVWQFQVFKNGKIIKEFWQTRDNGIGYSSVTGTKNVELSEDETHLLVTDEDDKITKIPLEE